MFLTMKLVPNIPQEFDYLIQKYRDEKDKEKLGEIRTEIYNIVSDISLSAFNDGIRFDVKDIEINHISFVANKLKKL